MRTFIVLGMALAWAWPTTTQACPFCDSIAPTMADLIDGADVAVLARLVRVEQSSPQPATPGQLGFLPDEPDGVFQVQEVLKGGSKEIAAGVSVRTPYTGSEPAGTLFLLNGNRAPEFYWYTPISLPRGGPAYVKQAMALPKEGSERLKYFLNYLQHDEVQFDNDAYDEFAKAPYDDVKGLAPQFDRRKLWTWIDDPKITAQRKRLYYLMLSLCGDASDRQRLENLLKARSKSLPTEALDSIIAAYLGLAKEEGLPLIEQEFFHNRDVIREDVYAAITAIRFHGQEETIIPRDRLKQVFRKLLDRPEMAEMVLVDLARWEDWTIIDPLVALFKTADKDSYFIRTPVVQYLAVCPLPEAKQQLEELRAIDPQAVSRGIFFAQNNNSAEVAAPSPGAASVPAPSMSAASIALRTVAAEEPQTQRRPANGEQPFADATLLWSLVAAGVALLALLTVFFSHHRRQENGERKPKSGTA